MQRVRPLWTRRVVAALLAVVLPTALIVLVNPSPAAAAARHGTSFTFTVPAGVRSLSIGGHGTRVTAVKTPQAVAQTAQCTVFASTPVAYTGSSSGEEAFGEVDCNIVMYGLEVEVGLFRNGAQVTYNENTQYNVVLVNVLTTYQRLSGQYKSEADGYGLETSTGTLETYPLVSSPTVPL
jgi:hypothetical protein